MLKYFKATFFLLLFVLFLEPAQKLMSNFLRLEQPTVHEIRDGDWFSKLAQQYYGDSSYWRELALINRAPDGDLIFPGENVIVPGFETIRRIRNARKLSVVNELVKEQQSILAGLNSVPEAGSPDVTTGVTVQPVAKTVDDDAGVIVSGTQSEAKESQVLQAGSGKALALAGAGVVVLILVVGGFRFVRKRRQEEVSYYGQTEAGEDAVPNNGLYFDRYENESEEIADEEEEQTNRKQVDTLV